MAEPLIIPPVDDDAWWALVFRCKAETARADAAEERAARLRAALEKIAACDMLTIPAERIADAPYWLNVLRRVRAQDDELIESLRPEPPA